MKNKKLYHILSWTWGLPMNLIGHMIAKILLSMQYKPKKWGGCQYFVVGENWGAISLGTIVIVSKNHTEFMLNHEFGHSIQNCYFGFLFPFVVAIPSYIRYWYYCTSVKFGLKDSNKMSDYYNAWFEKQASELGENSIKYW